MSSTVLTIKMQVNNSIRYVRQRIPVDKNIPSCLNSSGVAGAYNCFSKGYGMYKKGKFFYDMIDGVFAAQKDLPYSTIGPALGAPGVFSISPFPVVDKNGRLGFSVSGILFDRILEITVGTMRVFYKGNLYWGTGPVAM